MKLKEKRIVVTGGSKGLGRALVTRFAAEGAKVAFCARNWDELNRVALGLSVQGFSPVFAVCDVANPEQVEQFSETVHSEFDSVDVVINNAAILGSRGEIREWTRSAWERVIDVNVNGPFLITRAFLNRMIEQRRGLIVNVTSSVGKVGRAKWGAYAVSKFALEGFTQTLAEEVQQFGIKVISVNPGALNTEMRHQAYPDEDRSRLTDPSHIAEVFTDIILHASRLKTGGSLDAQEYFKKNKELV